MDPQEIDTSFADLLHEHRRHIAPQQALLWMQRGRVLATLLRWLFSRPRDPGPTLDGGGASGPVRVNPT